MAWDSLALKPLPVPAVPVSQGKGGDRRKPTLEPEVKSALSAGEGESRGADEEQLVRWKAQHHKPWRAKKECQHGSSQ